MTNPPVRLKVLLREKHWQTHRTFCAEYDKAARTIDHALVGTWPSRAQLHRWLSGELKGLPYPDHCRVLEKMLPGWSVEQLFEKCPPEESSQPASDPTAPPAAEVGELLEVIGDRLEAPEAMEATWGRSRVPVAAGVGSGVASVSQVLGDQAAEGVSEHVRALGRGLLELQRLRRFSDNEIRELAGLAGHVVDLSESVEIDIDAEGGARVVYHFNLLNLSDKPVTRMTREVWFEHSTRHPLTITPTVDGDRRVVIQRIHDTANLSKFAYQISPPLRPGESARVGYVVEGGKFDVNHYWRQTMPRYARHYTVRVRQEGIQLGGCTASEEHPDGSENSANDSLMWDYEGDTALMLLTRDYLEPNQAVTLRWEVIRGSA